MGTQTSNVHVFSALQGHTVYWYALTYSLHGRRRPIEFSYASPLSSSGQTSASLVADCLKYVTTIVVDQRQVGGVPHPVGLP